MEQIVQLNSNANLSEHFKLGEFTRSNSHPEVYNIPSHEAIANLKRVCGWLEVLRKRYNACNLERSREISPCATLSRHDKEKPIIINSGYRSQQLNKKIGGVPTSNHLSSYSIADCDSHYL